MTLSSPGLVKVVKNVNVRLSRIERWDVSTDNEGCKKVIKIIFNLYRKECVKKSKGRKVGGWCWSERCRKNRVKLEAVCGISGSSRFRLAAEGWQSAWRSNQNQFILLLAVPFCFLFQSARYHMLRTWLYVRDSSLETQLVIQTWVWRCLALLFGSHGTLTAFLLRVILRSVMEIMTGNGEFSDPWLEIDLVKASRVGFPLQSHFLCSNKFM